MNPRLFVTTALVVADLFLHGCAAPPAGVGGSASAAKPASRSVAVLMQAIAKKIESQVPELARVGEVSATAPTERPEQASAGFILPEYAGRDLHELVRQGVRFNALEISLRRFTSSDDGRKYLVQTFLERPAADPLKEDYRGAVIYRYASGGGTVLGQDGLFVVEIDPVSERGGLVAMKVLDIVLAELAAEATRSEVDGQEMNINTDKPWAEPMAPSVITSGGTNTRGGVTDIKITFVKPPVAPSLSLDLEVSEIVLKTNGFASRPVIKPGALANIAAGRVSALTVTWADPERFKTENETQLFLRDLLSNANEDNWAFHAWSYGEGEPSVVATVGYVGGKQGQWFVWCSPNIAWAYQDETGKWWWGMPKAPKPK